jgi:hypothetical protein
MLNEAIAKNFCLISKASVYSGCHKYVPFAGFPKRRKCNVQHPEIITNMTTALSMTDWQSIVRKRAAVLKRRHQHDSVASRRYFTKHGGILGVRCQAPGYWPLASGLWLKLH